MCWSSMSLFPTIFSFNQPSRMAHINNFVSLFVRRISRFNKAFMDNGRFLYIYANQIYLMKLWMINCIGCDAVIYKLSNNILTEILLYQFCLIHITTLDPNYCCLDLQKKKKNIFLKNVQVQKCYVTKISVLDHKTLRDWSG